MPIIQDNTVPFKHILNRARLKGTVSQATLKATKADEGRKPWKAFGGGQQQHQQQQQLKSKRKYKGMADLAIMYEALDILCNFDDAILLPTLVARVRCCF